MNRKRLAYKLERFERRFNIYRIIKVIQECKSEGYFTHCEFSSRRNIRCRRVKLFFAWILNAKCRCGDGWSGSGFFCPREVCDDCNGFALNYQWSLRVCIKTFFAAKQVRTGQVRIYEYQYLRKMGLN